MGAHWWEWGPPALQATGGFVQLLGAGLLAYEWRRSTAEAREAAELKREKILRSGFENLPNNINNIKTIKQMKIALSQMTLWQMKNSMSDVDDQPESSYRFVTLGFVFIALGMVVQLIANGITWAAACDLLK